MNIFKSAVKFLYDKWVNEEIPKKNDYTTKNKLIYNHTSKEVTIITPEGISFVKENVDSELLDSLLYAEISEIKDIFRKIDNPIDINGKEIDYISDKVVNTAVINNIEILRDHVDFNTIDDKLYFSGINSMPIPDLIAAAFIENAINQKDAFNLGLNRQSLIDEYNALFYFTLKLFCNPIKDCRDSLMDFIKNNDIKITSWGNLVTYRRANRVNGEGNIALIKFITEQYLRIKIQKKSPKNYSIYYNNDYPHIFHLIKNHKIATSSFQEENNVLVGNLRDSYENIGDFEENLFTSTHDNRVRFKVGSIYKLDPSKVVLNRGNCAAGGLHSGSRHHNFSGYGDTPLVCLLNPAKTLVVPSSEFSKIRSEEMFILAINPNEGEHYDDINKIHMFDEQYHNTSKEELINTIQQLGTLPVIENNSTELNTDELNGIINKLSQAKIILI